jgi:protein O-mannosyl-transferase
MLENKKNILIIVFVGFILFFNSFFNGFVWDDEDQILGNELVHSVANIPKFFSGGSFGSGGVGVMTGAYYRPVMALIFSITYSIFGPNAFFFHFFQAVIFTANAVFVYLIFEKLFKDQKRQFKVLPLLLSLIFLVHPLVSEVSLYSANIQDTLFFFFGILYLYLFVTQVYSLRYKVIFILLPLASLLSKETGILFACVSVVYVYFFERKNLLKVVFHWGTAIGIYLFMRLAIAEIGFGVKNINIMFQITSYQRLLTIPKVLVEAILGFFAPFGYVLTLNQHWAVLSPNLTDFYLPLIFLAIITSLIVFVGIKLKDKLYWFFFFWFLLGLALHSQLLPLDVTFSGRFYYFSLVGLLGLTRFLLVNAKYQRITTWVLILIISVFSVTTFIRSFDFRNGLALYSHEEKYQKDNYNLENNLGVELYRVGKTDDASIHFQKSIDLNPNWWTAYNNLGAYYDSKGELERASGLYLASIEKGNYYLAIENYGKILYRQKRYPELKVFLRKYLPYFSNNQTLNLLWQGI